MNQPRRLISYIHRIRHLFCTYSIRPLSNQSQTEGVDTHVSECMFCEEGGDVTFLRMYFYVLCFFLRFVTSMCVVVEHADGDGKGR